MSLRLGWRREVVILLPVATLVLVLLSTFSLFAFRSGVELLAEARRQEAAALAQRVAANLPSDSRPTSLRLRELAPGARSVALTGLDGVPVVSSGGVEGLNLLAPLADLELDRAVGIGPGDALPDVVAGFARLESRGRDLLLRVDLPAAQLARQMHVMRVLTWVVLPVNVALSVLLVLFLRHVLEPFDALVERVRGVGEGSDAEDDISHLVATVERALATLSSADRGDPDDDVRALQRVLGPGLASGVMLLDRNGVPLTLNAAGARLLGIAQDAGASEPGAALAAAPAFAEAVRRAVEEAEGMQRSEVEIESPSGGRTLGTTVHPLLRDDGSARGYLVLFVDLTESRRRAEEESLARSLQQLGELTAGVAHEMRNGLATLKGYLTLIERLPDEESIGDYLQEMRRESDHLQRVLEDFLSFARPETTRLEEIDLVRVIHRAAADPALAGKPVEVHNQAGEGSRIKGDALLIERAVRNLLHNAAEAEREAGVSGSLEVTVRRHEEGMEVVIRDRGPGLPEGLEERLFQPFVSARRGGIGLGLALAHRIVSLHGGRLRLEGIADGGVRATLVFPESGGS